MMASHRKPQRHAGRTRLIAIIAVGVLVRLLLMPFTMHHDARFVGDLVAMHVDARHFVQDDPALETALYPPLAYYTLAAYQQMIMPLLPEIRAIEKTPETAEDWFTHPRRYLRLFVLKIWHLPFDILTGMLLLAMVGQAKKHLVALLWFWNPIVIYSGAVHGQFDAVPVCATVAAWWLLRERRYIAAGVLLGLGAAFKVYPLLLVLPAYVLLYSEAGAWRVLVSSAIIFLLPYMGQMAHYAGQHPYYTGSLSLVMNSAGQVWSIFAAGYTLFLWVLWRYGRGGGMAIDAVWSVVLLGYLMQAAFDAHYLMWVLPFTIWQWVIQPDTRVAGWVLLGCIAVLYTPVLPGAYLLPLNYTYYLTLPTISDGLGQVLPLSLLLAGVRGVLIGTLGWLAMRAISRLFFAAADCADVIPTDAD